MTGERRIEVGAARPRRSRRFRVSIGLALGLGIAFLIAAPLAIVIILNTGANRANTYSLLNQRVLLLVDAIETGTRRHLEAAAEAVDFATRLHREGSIDLTDPDVALPMLKGASAAMPNVEALMIHAGEHEITGIIRDREGAWNVIPPGFEPSPQVRRAVAAAEARNQAGWGPLVFEDGRVYANYAAPFGREGEPGGLLLAAVSLTTLSQILADISTDFDTTAFILDADGRVVAHPNLVSAHPEITPESPTVAIDRVGDLVLSAYPRREWMEEFAFVRERAGIEVSLVEVGGDPYILITREIDGVSPRPWTVGAHFAASEVGTEVERLILVLAVSAAAFLIALALAFVLSGLLARQFSRFAARAALITGLDLDRVEAMPPSRIREIDESATAFNAMLDGLKAFAAYVPRTLVNRLVHSGIKATTRSSERTLTIMFTDIVGFTTLAERMPAAEAAELLNRHFRILCTIVEANGGTVDKFVGDGLMAFWGAPEPLRDHALAACRSALAIAEAVERDTAAAVREGRAPVRIRIGIHTGPVIVGNIGGDGRINYTIVGDAVNVCQRLEDLGHTIAPGATAAIFVSEDTVGSAGACAGLRLEEAGSQALRGRTSELKVYRLIGLARGS